MFLFYFSHPCFLCSLPQHERFVFLICDTFLIYLFTVFCDIIQSRHFIFFIYLNYIFMLTLIVTGLFDVHFALLPAAIFFILGSIRHKRASLRQFRCTKPLKSVYCKLCSQAVSCLTVSTLPHEHIIGTTKSCDLTNRCWYIYFFFLCLGLPGTQIKMYP